MVLPLGLRCSRIPLSLPHSDGSTPPSGQIAVEGGKYLYLYPDDRMT